jgi:hypothetical protein
MFQVLTRARAWSVRVRHWLRDLAPELYRSLRDVVSRRPRWEMNTLSEDEARAIVERAGARVLAIIDEASSNSVFESRWFIVGKELR